jgi:hypothetical protein
MWEDEVDAQALIAGCRVTYIKWKYWRRRRLVYTLPLLLFIFSGSAAKHGLWPPCPQGFLITQNDAPQSVGLLWMSDQLIVEISTWQHTTHTTNKHPCPQWNSNPRQQ